MPLRPNEFVRLAEALLRRGWRWSRQGSKKELCGPNDQWFAEKRHASLADYRDWAVTKKCELVELGAEPAYVADFRSLADALEELCDDGGLEAFFAAIEPTLFEFARRRNLRILKYATREPRWSFDFLHPAGFHGTRCTHGSLDVYRHSRGHVWFHLCLIEDDARTRTRRLRREQTPVQCLDAIDLMSELDRHFLTIIGGEPKDWTDVPEPDPPMHPTEEEVEEHLKNLREYYPIPRV